MEICMFYLSKKSRVKNMIDGDGQNVRNWSFTFRIFWPRNFCLQLRKNSCCLVSIAIDNHHNISVSLLIVLCERITKNHQDICYPRNLQTWIIACFVLHTQHNCIQPNSLAFWWKANYEPCSIGICRLKLCSSEIKVSVREMPGIAWSLSTRIYFRCSLSCAYTLINIE